MEFHNHCRICKLTKEMISFTHHFVGQLNLDTSALKKIQETALNAALQTPGVDSYMLLAAFTSLAIGFLGTHAGADHGKIIT